MSRESVRESIPHFATAHWTEFLVWKRFRPKDENATAGPSPFAALRVRMTTLFADNFHIRVTAFAFLISGAIEKAPEKSAPLYRIEGSGISSVTSEQPDVDSVLHPDMKMQPRTPPLRCAPVGMTPLWGCRRCGVTMTSRLFQARNRGHRRAGTRVKARQAVAATEPRRRVRERFVRVQRW